MRYRLVLVLAAAGALASPASSQDMMAPSLRDSFRLGSSGDTLCRVQSSGTDKALRGMFDRAYAIVCRDAAQPVGRIYALRKTGGDPRTRLGEMRGGMTQCEGAATSTTLDELRNVSVTQCRLSGVDVGYRVYAYDAGKTLYVAEGLAGYESALTLGLRTIVADKIVPGEISIASTEVGDPAAFARVQAGTLDIDQAREEGYRRNNSGNYAEAAEFFETLLQRSQDDPESRRYMGEFLINRALQRSNLGAFGEADALFLQADLIPTADPVQLRLRRNFKALHLLNQRKFAEAKTLLEKPLETSGAAMTSGGNAPIIGASAAETINSALPLAQQLAGVEGASLTPEERAAILDAQALLLLGTIDRLQNRPADAEQKLVKSQAELLAIRGGRVTSIARLRSQALAEQSVLSEARGDFVGAEQQLRQAVAVLAIEYPDSVAVAAANARLAAYLARRGQTDAAITIYRSIVNRAGDDALSSNVPGDLLAPYFAVLAREIPQRPELAADFFLASETLVRPGVASTQAVLARELSAGSDEGSRLFRQAITLTREVEQARIALARMTANEDANPGQGEQIAALRAELDTLQANQAATQSRLAEFPRYRAISTKALTLDDLRATLQPGEAYLKLSEVGGAMYAMLVTSDYATAYRTSISARNLETNVQALRDSIAKVENDQLLTYPFDVARARKLYVDLFGPISPQLLAAKHVVFEPAGAMLKLPPNLLIVDDESVARYRAQAKTDEFDFRNIRWFGRERDISTAVSARAFRDVRDVAPSKAKLEYLGLGQNAPVSPMLTLASGTRGLQEGGTDCSWSLSEWNHPISASELRTAQGIIGANEAQLITGSDFTDTAIQQRQDLSSYRILHFATHGLVTAPRPECPARPALLTSFATDARGQLASDGLLTFRDIFDLKLDADLVILSACDTAGAATAAATQEAGVSGGGDFALDGLVRAFVGAGGRSVVASHWPAPDDYNATERLISGLFKAPRGTSVASALRTAEVALMDEADTSHPYYWSGFAIVGDGSRPILRAQ